MAESTVWGMTARKFGELEDYPVNQDVELNGIKYFREDSYKDDADYDWLSARFAKASKNQEGKDRGTPDFIVVKKTASTIIVVECKKDKKKHSAKSHVEEYIIDGYGDAKATEDYAIDGALWYAEFLKDTYDVIVIAVSGTKETESRVTSFVYPRGGDIHDVRLIEDGNIKDSLVSISQYEKDIIGILGRNAATEEEVKKELRKYTLACANYLRANGIEDDSKAGFVSAIILGLTNKQSRLYKDVSAAYKVKMSRKSKTMDSDPIGKESVKLLKEALYGNGRDEYEDDHVPGIFDIDKIPKGKRKSLKKFYDMLLSKDELTKTPKSKTGYFKDGDTVLSGCIFSLFENILIVLERYRGIDIMGEFYTTFLRFTKGNAKEKGIVLTPKHITDLFCDIAEYYGGKKFDENTKILDICCGTGAFLISSLNRIRGNIDALKISDDKKTEKLKVAQKFSLIGVEQNASMYALAYANMRFHGDGKSNLFNCSSLMSDSFLATDGSGDAYVDDGRPKRIHEALRDLGDIDIGMINPPYSLGKNDDAKPKEYPIITEINSIKEKIKKLKKQKKDGKDVESEIENAKKELELKEKECKNSGLEEVVIQKGQDELDFIASMLHYLKVGGIGIAIVPMSCAGNSGKSLRAEILRHHTLLACMSMPSQLFQESHVGTSTCIMVFKAHIPHDEDKAVFFGRWREDGFKVIPHNGRKDTGAWNDIRKDWIDQIDGIAKPDDKIWMKKKIAITDEALAEAYVETDYSKLTDADFERTLKKYALFKYMEANGLLEA